MIYVCMKVIEAFISVECEMSVCATMTCRCVNVSPQQVPLAGPAVRQEAPGARHYTARLHLSLRSLLMRLILTSMNRKGSPRKYNDNDDLHNDNYYEDIMI